MTTQTKMLAGRINSGLDGFWAFLGFTVAGVTLCSVAPFVFVAGYLLIHDSTMRALAAGLTLGLIYIGFVVADAAGIVAIILRRWQHGK